MNRRLRAFGLWMLFLVSNVGAQEPTPTPRPLPPNVETFTIRTRSPENPQVPFYLRIPGSYEAGRKDRVHRVLYICPVVNGDAQTVVLGEKDYKPLVELSEEQGWFVLSGTFKVKSGAVQKRESCYYYPETFSGRAVVEAIGVVAKKYRIDPDRIFMQGLSGGAQFVHRFAIWAPERVTAVAVNSSSWFDEPNAKSSNTAWLVTIGESDDSFGNSLEFVDRLRRVGAAPLFRSYVGMVHEGSSAVSRLNVAFLRHYDEVTQAHLGRRRTGFSEPERILPDQMPFVGDSQDWRFFPNTKENCEAIAEDSRIFLPSRDVAGVWGSAELAE